MNRLDRVRARLDEAKLDGLLVSGPVDDVFGRHSQNRRWLSGFTGSTGRVVITRDRAVIAVDFRYVEQAERECVPLGFEIFKVEGREKEWLPRLVEAAVEKGMSRSALFVAAMERYLFDLETERLRKYLDELPDDAFELAEEERAELNEGLAEAMKRMDEEDGGWPEYN